MISSVGPTSRICLQDQFGDCLVPKRYWGDYQLGDWTYRVRLMLKDKKLAVSHFEALEAMGFPWAIPVVRAPPPPPIHTNYSHSSGGNSLHRVGPQHLESRAIIDVYICTKPKP